MLDTRFSHQVLIVDDDKLVAKALSRRLSRHHIDPICAESGPEGLKRLRSASKPFSLILSDQRMPAMLGTDFLAQVKESHPATVRFLITGYSDIDTVISSINKGAVHRFFLKPWNETLLMNEIKYSLHQYETTLENERLLCVARKQHKQLLRMEDELMALTKNLVLAIRKRDREIDEIENEIAESQPPSTYHPDHIFPKLEKYLLQLGAHGDGDDNDTVKNIHQFYKASIRMIFHEFDELAQRNGFEMPLPFKDEM